MAAFLRGVRNDNIPQRCLKNDSSPEFNVGQRIEALLGTDRQLVGGVITKVNGNGTYGIIFDSGHEFTALDGQLLTVEINKIVELETQLAQVFIFTLLFVFVASFVEVFV